MSDDLILQQARALNVTIGRLQTRLLIRNIHGHGAGSSSKELTLAQVTTLLVIRDKGEVTIKELADATQVSPPSASGMVERLVEIDLLKREAGRVDRRQVRVSLKEAGLAIVDRLEEQLLESLMLTLNRIGPEMAAKWCEVYERINEILNETEQDGCEVAGAKSPVRLGSVIG